MIVGALFTLAIFSYLLGDNPLYRLAIHVFTGAAAAFVVIVAVESVLGPWLQTWIFSTIENPDLLSRASRVFVGITPFLIGYALLQKLSPRRSRQGTIGMAIMVGVGVAVSLWGAVNGTLIPLIAETGNSLRTLPIIDAFITLVGTVSVLVYFTYIGVRRPSGKVEQALPVRLTGEVGKFFFTITLGATYGLMIISALTVLTSVVSDRILPLFGR